MGFSYKSKQWGRKRAAILRRDAYQCQWAKRFGRIEPADTVHHIFPVEHYPEHAMSSWNLISVSRDAHNQLHDRTTHELSEDGLALMRETAVKMGMRTEPEDNGITLIIGRPGTGKTTLAQKMTRHSGICYDLDAIADAFRLGNPGTDRARMLANDLLQGFAVKATQYDSKVVIVRTMPGRDELDRIRPDRVVLLSKIYEDHGIDVKDYDRRLAAVRNWCEDNRIELQDTPPR